MGNNSQEKTEWQFSSLVMILTSCDNWCKSTLGWDRDRVVISSAYQNHLQQVVMSYFSQIITKLSGVLEIAVLTILT